MGGGVRVVWWCGWWGEGVHGGGVGGEWDEVHGGGVGGRQGVHSGGVWVVGRVCGGVEVYMVRCWWWVVITVQQVCSYPYL